MKWNYDFDHTDLPQNFCRNPNKELQPWCVYGSTDADTENCEIPICASPLPPPSPLPPSLPPYPPDKAPLPPPPSQPPPSPPPVGCYEGKGADYKGGAVLTVSGWLCQEWALCLGEECDAQWALLPENFCRNPDDSARPWCRTTNNASMFKDAPWEDCDIPLCPFPSPPPQYPPPPAAPPGLCTDTCNSQVGGAQHDICDDGVGRRDGVAGICEPGAVRLGLALP